ncbi:hypothetical protein BC567DRAFT_29225 [Phyllosticta citribraziliensis]
MHTRHATRSVPEELYIRQNPTADIHTSASAIQWCCRICLLRGSALGGGGWSSPQTGHYPCIHHAWLGPHPAGTILEHRGGDRLYFAPSHRMSCVAFGRHLFHIMPAVVSSNTHLLQWEIGILSSKNQLQPRTGSIECAKSRTCGQGNEDRQIHPRLHSGTR